MAGLQGMAAPPVCKTAIQHHDYDAKHRALLWEMQIWLEMAGPPSQDDVDMLETVLTSWFMIGRLGGYNSMNLQAMSFPHHQQHPQFKSERAC